MAQPARHHDKSRKTPPAAIQSSPPCKIRTDSPYERGKWGAGRDAHIDFDSPGNEDRGQSVNSSREPVNHQGIGVFDLAIYGSGFAAYSVAQPAIRRGLSVLVVEKGPRDDTLAS